MNFEKDVLIDENALDVEWVNQAALATTYGKHWAECMRKRTQAEEHVKLTRSKLIKKAHDNPDKYLGEGIKPTGPVVESFYREHKDHIQAKDELIEADYELNIAEIAKREISVTRKSALQNLVELHGQQYFAGPSVPRNLSLEVTKRKETVEVNQKVGKKLKRRRTT